MPPVKDELKRIAQMSVRERKTAAEIAREVGVSAKTVGVWMRSSEYVSTVYELRKTWKEEARNRVAGLAEDVMQTLEELMTNSRNDRVRLEAAQTLGEWLGLAEPETETHGDDREDLVEALKLAAARSVQAPTIVFMPPAPGGLLPEYLQAPRPSILDVTPQEEERVEKREEGRGEL
jgi:transposase-like protein